MTNENAPKRLTQDDPIGKEDLAKLAELEQAEVGSSMQLMSLELEKVKLLAMGRKVFDERMKIFERLLSDRGLPLDAQVMVDAATGKLTILPSNGKR